MVRKSTAKKYSDRTCKNNKDHLKKYSITSANSPTKTPQECHLDLIGFIKKINFTHNIKNDAIELTFDIFF